MYDCLIRRKEDEEWLPSLFLSPLQLAMFSLRVQSQVILIGWNADSF